jgi:hypothetical protein
MSLPSRTDVPLQTTNEIRGRSASEEEQDRPESFWRARLESEAAWAMVSQLPSGPDSVFRDGQGLTGDEAVAAMYELNR